jgi:putative FmdB family regulatory protein
MPIYEYVCRSCRTQFERLIRPTGTAEPEVVTCPSCSGSDLERLLSMFAVNSEGTQQAHLRQARKVGMKEHREKQHAEAETIRHIHEEHDH